MRRTKTLAVLVLLIGITILTYAVIWYWASTPMFI
jgi:hypothetical protein